LQDLEDLRYGTQRSNRLPLPVPPHE